MLTCTNSHEHLNSSPCKSCGMRYERGADGKWRRVTLPATVHERKSSENAFFSFVRRLIGMELTRAGFPIKFFEPSSWLLRQTEVHMNIDKLRAANAISNPIERMAQVVGVFVSTVQMYVNSDRIMAFNPILGETFEFYRPDYGFRFVIEQINHHPPVFATHFESIDRNGQPDGIYRGYGNGSVKASFSGVTLEARPVGFTTFELLQRGEVYTMIPEMKIVIGNVFKGLDRCNHRLDGKMTVSRVMLNDRENDNQMHAQVDFHAPTQGVSWLGGWVETEDPSWCDGAIENGAGEKLLSFYGKYNQEIFSVPVNVWESTGGWKKAMAANRKEFHQHKKNHHKYSSLKQDHSVVAAMTPDGKSMFDFNLPHQKLLWRKDPLPAYAKDYNSMTTFGIQLNTPEPDLHLPPTDTRHRMDLRYLEVGDLDSASKEKHRLEEKQRVDLRLRLAEAGLKAGDADPWLPRWFRRASHPYAQALADCWIFNGQYYKRDWSNAPNLGFLASTEEE